VESKGRRPVSRTKDKVRTRHALFGIKSSRDQSPSVRHAPGMGLTWSRAPEELLNGSSPSRYQPLVHARLAAPEWRRTRRHRREVPGAGRSIPAWPNGRDRRCWPAGSARATSAASGPGNWTANSCRSGRALSKCFLTMKGEFEDPGWWFSTTGCSCPVRWRVRRARASASWRSGEVCAPSRSGKSLAE